VFPGEAQVDVALAGGPTRDFNLMLRRGRARGGLEVWRDAGPRVPEAGVALVYCARGAIVVAREMLRPGDAWRPSPGVSSALELLPGAVALAVRIEDAP
jgi:hypothetical protein